MRKTNRGFKVKEFTDLNGEKGSIQESSLATKDAIWLGLDQGTHVDGHCLARMHLDRTRAKLLIKLLTKFVETGHL